MLQYIFNEEKKKEKAQVEALKLLLNKNLFIQTSWHGLPERKSQNLV